MRPNLQAIRALGRMKSGQMNKQESEYSAHLQAQLLSGDILWWRFEAIKLRLASNTFYTPDFAVMSASREIELHEVKGHWQDDARVKIKVAAEQYPMFKFTAVKKLAKKAGGGWSEEPF